MVDVLDYGRRPLLKNTAGQDPRSEQAMKVCPGIGLEHTFDSSDPGLIQELAPAWGPIVEMWEGNAGDPEIRFAGSSGGAVSALALYCIEKAAMHGVLHTAARSDVPYLNHTVMSTTRGEILANTGSRYAPASPCEGLALIDQAPKPCVFVGKPCDVAAAQKARKMRPELERNLGLTIAFFCAGTPSTKGTLEMIRRMGIEDPSKLVSLRYRGRGWPGKATAVVDTDNGRETKELTYEQSWGDILTNYVQWRCKVCVDHTGEFADIAVGDPWYRPVLPDEPGQSLILARTRLGQKVIRDAIDAGYLIAQNCASNILPDSQPNLLRTRGAVWGRIFASRMIGRAVPRYRRMPMFRFWLGKLTLKQKVQSIVGTWKRIWKSNRSIGLES